MELAAQARAAAAALLGVCVLLYIAGKVARELRGDEPTVEEGMFRTIVTDEEGDFPGMGGRWKLGLEAPSPDLMRAAMDSVATCTWEVRDDMLTEDGFIKTGWTPELKNYLQELAWFNASTFYLLGFKPDVIAVNTRTRKVIDAHYENYSHPSLEGTVEKLEDIGSHLEAIFKPRPAACTPARCEEVPTRTQQDGDKQELPYLCHVNPADVPIQPPRADIWRDSKRRERIPRDLSKGPRMSLVAAVSNLTPHMLELIEHAYKIEAAHYYLGVCADEKLMDSYREMLSKYIDAGFASLVNIGTSAEAYTPGIKSRFKNIVACRNPSYQMALYDAKFHGDNFLFVSDIDEILVPVGESISLPVLMTEAVQRLPMPIEETCYMVLHPDRAAWKDETVSKNKTGFYSLKERFPYRCSCPLAPLESRRVSGINDGCGGVTYVKAIANVETVFYCNIHAHSACTVHDMSIYHDRPRDSPRTRYWLDPELIRILHFTNLWVSRTTRSCRGISATLVPTEFGSQRFLDAPHL